MANDISLPKFTKKERDRRYKTVRGEMAARGLDCLVVPHNTGDWDGYQPDVRYLTLIGGGGSAAACVLPMEGEPIAFCREPGRIEFWKTVQDWVSDVRAPKGAIWSDAIVEAIQELGYEKGRIGISGLGGVFREPEGTINHGEFTSMQRQLPGATFENATDIMHDIRSVKSAEEIKMMELAQVCADAVSEAVFETARPGVSEHEVYAEMMAAHIRNGGKVPAMMLMCSGKQAGQTFLLPTFRKLEPNDVLFVEADTKYVGYQAQCDETVSMGTPPTNEYERLFDISRDCFHLILENMKPGVAWADLVQMFFDHAEKSGAKPGFGIGHGLGQGQDVPMARTGIDPKLLVEEGNCFILKPSISSIDGSIKNRAGNTVVVEKSGARRLGQLDMQMRRLG